MLKGELSYLLMNAWGKYCTQLSLLSRAAHVEEMPNITTGSLCPWKGHSVTSSWTAEKCRSRRGNCPSTRMTKRPLSVFEGTDQGFGTWGYEKEARTPLLSNEGHRYLCHDWDLYPGWSGCDLMWGLWMAATTQSLGTQVLCEGDKALPAVHRVTKQTTRFSLLSLGLLVSCKIATWVHLETTAGLQTMSLNKQKWQHQIGSLKTLSLCCVSAQGRQQTY